MKVIMSAYSCGPNEGSEAGLSWNWAMQMSRFHEVWVITRGNRRKAAIEAYIASNPLPNIHFVYCDLPKKYLFWKSGEWGTNIYYGLWQFLAYRLAKELVAENDIDLAHHVSFMSLARGSFVPFLGIPSIIGPVGGLQNVPSPMMPLIKKRFRERVRNLAVESIRFNPVVRACCRRASLIILANSSGADIIERLTDGKLMVGLQIGTNELPPNNSSESDPNRVTADGVAPRPINFSWSGRLVDHKGFELLIRGLESLHRRYEVSLNDLQIVVSGKGEEKDYYQSEIEKFGLQDYFDFKGWLSYDEMEAQWQAADALIFTSMRETTGMALQEAMMRGVPPIVVDHGGPKEMVTPEVGIKIAVAPLEVMADQLADAMHTFISDEMVRKEMGRKVHLRAKEHYSWQAVGEQMNDVYQSVVS